MKDDTSSMLFEFVTKDTPNEEKTSTEKQEQENFLKIVINTIFSSILKRAK